MKLALCLSGEVRTWEYCNHTIETAFPNCEVDIYATMWTRSSYVDQNKVLARKPKKAYLISDNDTYITQCKEFEEQVLTNTFEHYKGKTFDSWKFLPIYMLPRIERMARFSYDLIPDPTQYDYIIRSRYDHIYLKNIAEQLEESKLLLTEDIGGSAPWDTIGSWRMEYDGFAAGTPYTMHHYYQFTDWLPHYYEDDFCKDKLFKAESTLGLYINKIKSFNVKHTRDILGMQITENDYYNRTKPMDSGKSITNKRAVTLQQYKETLKKMHPMIYEKYNVEDMICA